MANELNSIGVVCQDVIMSTETAHDLFLWGQIGLMGCIFLVVFHLLVARPRKVLPLESVLICLHMIGLVPLAIIGPLVGALIAMRLTLERQLIVILSNSVLPFLASSELKRCTSLKTSVFLVLIF